MAQRQPLLPRVAFIVGAVAVMFTWPCFSRSQVFSRANPACFGSLRRAKPVSRGIGWAIVDQPSDHPAEGEECTREYLYWTENNGQTWRDITPPDMPTRSIGQVFFLDLSHGWMLSTDALGEEENARFYLFSTEDGGKHWRTLLLQRPMFKLRDDYTFPTQLFFSDSQHGWILWHWHMMNSSLDSLLSTTDGGRTWMRLPDPPGAGPLQFISARDGWMIGDPQDESGVGGAEGNQLWATRDGGANWHAISVPVPADLASTYFIALKLKNRSEGMLAAGVASTPHGATFRFLGCVTHNGGKTWRFSQFDALSAEPSIGDKHIFWSVFDRDTKKVTIQMDSNPISFALPAGFSLGGRFIEVDFIDDSNAWATYANGRRGLDLISTTDGGKTSQIITPPVAAQTPFPPPELFVVNGIVIRYPKRSLGFALPPPSDLPTGGRPIRFGPYTGGPMTIKGTGFLPENTVWFGTRPTQAASKDGEHLLFVVPADLPPGNYDVYVENAHGKTNAVEVAVRPPESLRISGIKYRSIRHMEELTIHPGEEIPIVGRGFLIENTVWFGTQAVAVQVTLSGGAYLRVVVPASLAPGPCEIYVTNASGKSNVVSVVIE